MCLYGATLHLLMKIMLLDQKQLLNRPCGEILLSDRVSNENKLSQKCSSNSPVVKFFMFHMHHINICTIRVRSGFYEPTLSSGGGGLDLGDTAAMKETTVPNWVTLTFILGCMKMEM